MASRAGPARGSGPGQCRTRARRRRLQAALLASAGKPLADLVVDERIARHQLRWCEGQVAAGRDASAVIAAMPPEHVSRQIVRVSAQTGLDVHTINNLVLEAVTSPSRTHRTHIAQTRPPALPGPTSVPPRTVSPAGAVASSSQSAAQRARAGFPVPLNASLHPPAPAALGTSPPVGSPSNQQHRSRTA